MIIANIIVFIFLGHSNMNNGCADVSQLVISDHVYAYGSEKGFYRQSDPKKFGIFPAMFLNEMALRYPEYNFGAVCCNYPSAKVSDYFTDHLRYAKLIDKILHIDNAATIGGMLCMFGFIEGKDSIEATQIDFQYRRMIEDIRDLCGNETLPVLISRYESNNKREKAIQAYTRYEPIIIRSLDDVVNYEKIKYFPIRNLPKPYHCENHHSTYEGYQILSRDAAIQIQLNNADFWSKNK